MKLDAPKPVNVEALQRLLRPGEAVWTIVILPEQTALFVVTPDRLTLTTVVVAQKFLEEQVRDIRETLQGVPDAAIKEGSPDARTQSRTGPGTDSDR